MAKPFVPASAQGLLDQRVKKLGEVTGAYGTGMMVRGGYGRNDYGYGANQGDVSLLARAITGVLPASELYPLLPPSKLPMITYPIQLQKVLVEEDHEVLEVMAVMVMALG